MYYPKFFSLLNEVNACTNSDVGNRRTPPADLFTFYMLLDVTIPPLTKVAGIAYIIVCSTGAPID